MKNIWIVANWKSNKTITEALQWVDAVGPRLRKQENVKIVVCPTFIAIEEVKKATLVGNYPLLVGAQDLSPFEDGPYTGEESARILSDVVDLAILGHSERRNNFGETDEMVAEKVKRARQYHIIPLVCVQDESTPIPSDVDLVAYEPIFAIGTGHPDTPANAIVITRQLKKKHGKNLNVLYGGSVTRNNAETYLQTDELNGLLIGGASLDPVEFLKIMEVVWLI